MATPLEVDIIDPPDLTSTLDQKSKVIKGQGYFGVVYSCRCAQHGLVAVKAISFKPQVKEEEFEQKIRRELGIWKRLNHPNIVPLLGTACREDFGSNYDCMVSMWMPNGTLADYVTRFLPLPDCIRLITGSAAGLEYLHSVAVIHGDLHPANILIDKDHNPRLTDFGFSHTLNPQKDLTYLWTGAVRHGAVMWVAPELRYPKLLRDLIGETKGETKGGAKIAGDIYSLGSIVLFILSGKLPWSKSEFKKKTQELQNPPRPSWPVIPDIVWDFIEQCWSPKAPRNRPSAQEVLSFSRNRLQQLLQPRPTSDVNVVLFGAVGCGKSSIINLLAEEPVAPVSTNIEPCTRQPQCYPIYIGEKRFRFWDTTGFGLPRGGDIDLLSPYEQAHAILRNLTDGVHLILLCARKDEISSSLGSLYWLINTFFFDSHAPVALVVTHFDTPEEPWWDANRDFVVSRTGIPIESIPRACTTTVRTRRDESRQMLTALLANCANAIMPPIPLRLNLYEKAAHDISTHCGLNDRDAVELVRNFSKPQYPVVVFFGKAGAGKSSVINLVAGRRVAQVSSDIDSCTLGPASYVINTPKKQLIVWDTVGFYGVREGRDTMKKAVTSSIQLIRDLSKESGIDLLVFVKGCGKLTSSELNCYRFFEEFLCEGQVPVAVVVTHLEDQDEPERWWDMDGERVLQFLSRNVIGHACITSLANTDHEDTDFSAKRSGSRWAVQTMLEDCVSSSREKTSDQPATRAGKRMGRGVEKMTAENLMDLFGLTKEQAKEAVRSYTGSR